MSEQSRSRDQRLDQTDALEGQPAHEVLRFAAERFAPRVVFATGLGVEGCVVIDLIARHALPVPVITLDTGLLFAESLALWQRLEHRYGIAIRRVAPELSLEQQAVVYGARLWERDPDRCCALRKLAPLSAALRGQDAWVSAIRRDQTADRAAAPVLARDARFGLWKLNPLAAWTSDDVWRYVRAHDVPVNRLHEHGYPSIGCVPCTEPVQAGEDPRAGRWRGRAKQECGLHTRPPVLPDARHEEQHSLEEQHGLKPPLQSEQQQTGGGGVWGAEPPAR